MRDHARGEAAPHCGRSDDDGEAAPFEHGPPMDLANSAASANFLAAYEAGDEQVLWQAIVYCAGHRIPL